MVSQFALALFAGLLVGALFSAIQIPIPAPPDLPGILGIVGILLGYRLVEWIGLGGDLLDVIGNLV